MEANLPETGVTKPDNQRNYSLTGATIGQGVYIQQSTNHNC